MASPCYGIDSRRVSGSVSRRPRGRRLVSSFFLSRSACRPDRVFAEIVTTLQRQPASPLHHDTAHDKKSPAMGTGLLQHQQRVAACEGYGAKTADPPSQRRAAKLVCQARGTAAHPRSSRSTALRDGPAFFTALFTLACDPVFFAS
jgi:hypothetical protein